MYGINLRHPCLCSRCLGQFGEVKTESYAKKSQEFIVVKILC